MSNSRRKLTLNSVSVNLGCGTCRRPKLGFIFHPKPKSKNPTSYQKHKLHHRHSSSSSTNWRDERDVDTSTSTTNTTPTTNTSFSPRYVESSSRLFCEYEKKSSSAAVKGFGTEGVAVEKDSDDPYLDFRHSMLQMILENEIYSKDGLRELLNCFLQLNSPQHHGVIVRAFTEIWNGVFSLNNRKSRDF